MKQKKKTHLQGIAIALLLLFCLARFVFVAYNHELSDAGIGGLLMAWLMGIPSDVATVAYALAIPALATLAAARWVNLPLRKILLPYWIVLGASVGCITVFDIVMYGHWQFKLGADAVEYAMSPEGATNSVSLWYIISCVGSAVLLSIATAVYCYRRVPKSLYEYAREVKSALCVLVVVLVTALLYRSGMSFSESQPIFVNHAAKNPVYNFYSTINLCSSYASRFHYMDEKESESLVAELYGKSDEHLTDTLLTTNRPDILVVLVESFGGKFVEELGGVPDVAPNISRLIPEGIFWDNYYSNSFRTDRGTVSLYSGMLSHPDVCLMKHSGFHASMPSLPQDLANQGYRTVSLMAQPMTNMGKGAYLENIGFQERYDCSFFAPEELEAAWGGHDGISSQKTVQLIAQKDSAQSLFLAYQTVSSHEPWEVPYHRLDDEVLNAFAYTDQCLGDMVDSLRLLPQWDNLLVIIVPDHGYLYDLNFSDPEFFHSPMLWLGGAVRAPRRMTTLLNQSDVAATLLAQLGLPYDHYRWSRNVLGSGYTKPFVYCNFPAGMMTLDEKGVSIFDFGAEKFILNRPDEGAGRLHRMQAIIQASYKELDDF